MNSTVGLIKGHFSGSVLRALNWRMGFFIPSDDMIGDFDADICETRIMNTEDEYWR